MPVYLRSDQAADEPCLLGTNIILPLGLMVPGPAWVQVKAGEAAKRCGVVMDALVEGCKGSTVMIESSRNS